MVREILIWPDPRLKQKALPVETIDDGIRKLVDDMFETMYAAEGVGLAANQIGVMKRVVVIDTGDEALGPFPMINPEILSSEGTISFREGCLSVPGEAEDVIRSPKVKVRFLDLEGKEVILEVEDLAAVAMQHEVDHLNGIVFVDHISSLKRERIRKRMKRAQAARAAETPSHP